MDHKALRASITKFVELSDEDFALLIQCVQYLTIKKGKALLAEGEICRSFYLVDKGYVRTWHNKEGVAINLNFTFEGDFTTNLKSFQSKTPSENIIEAGEDVGVWVFSFGHISPQFNHNPQINRFIRRIVMRLLVAAEEYGNLLKIYTPAERYHYIEQHNPQLLQRIPLSQIASYLGVTRETLSRIRNKANQKL